MRERETKIRRDSFVRSREREKERERERVRDGIDKHF